jgi:hypothetical protein
MSKLLGRPPERKYLPFKEKVDTLKPASKISRPEEQQQKKQQQQQQQPQQQSFFNQTVRNNNNNNPAVTKKSTSTFNLIPWGTGQAKKIMGSNSSELSKKLLNAKIFQRYNIFTKLWYIDKSAYTGKSVHKTFSALKRKLTKSMTAFEDFNLDESLWNMKLYCALFPTNKDAIDFINEHKKSWFLDTIQEKLSKLIRIKKGTVEPLMKFQEKDTDILEMQKLKLDDFKDLEAVKKKIPFLTEIFTEDIKEFITRVLNELKNMAYENAETVLEKAETGEEKKEIKEKRFRLFGSKTSDEIVGTTVQEFTERINKAKIYRNYNLVTKQWDIDPFLETKVTNRKRQYYNLKKYIKKELTTFEDVEGLSPPEWDESVFCALFPKSTLAIQKVNEKKIDAVRDILFRMRFDFKPSVKKENYIKFRNSPDGKEIFDLSLEQLKDVDALEKRPGFTFLKGNKDEVKNALEKLQLDEAPKVGGGVTKKKNRFRKTMKKRRKRNFIF